MMIKWNAIRAFATSQLHLTSHTSKSKPGEQLCPQSSLGSGRVWRSHPLWHFGEVQKSFWQLRTQDGFLPFDEFLLAVISFSPTRLNPISYTAQLTWSCYAPGIDRGDFFKAWHGDRGKTERKSIPGKLLQDPNCVLCQRRIGTEIEVAGMCFTQGLWGGWVCLDVTPNPAVPDAGEARGSSYLPVDSVKLGFRGQTESYPLLIANTGICESYKPLVWEPVDADTELAVVGRRHGEKLWNF